MGCVLWSTAPIERFTESAIVPRGAFTHQQELLMATPARHPWTVSTSLGLMRQAGVGCIDNLYLDCVLHIYECIWVSLGYRSAGLGGKKL